MTHSPSTFSRLNWRVAIWEREPAPGLVARVGEDYPSTWLEQFRRRGLDTRGIPFPFDFEGVPRQRVVTVESGVPRSPVYDRTTARKEGRRSTGHALPPPNTFGPAALNLVMSPGAATVQEMIRTTARGLYITRFWYTRVVHPRDCVITGMTRDGTFLIEHGELTRPVKNLRFTQGYVPALAGVEMIGQEARTLVGGFVGASRVPALKLREFNFTGTTQ